MPLPLRTEWLSSLSSLVVPPSTELASPLLPLPFLVIFLLTTSSFYPFLLTPLVPLVPLLIVSSTAPLLPSLALLLLLPLTLLSFLHLIPRLLQSPTLPMVPPASPTCSLVLTIVGHNPILLPASATLVTLPTLVVGLLNSLVLMSPLLSPLTLARA